MLYAVLILLIMIKTIEQIENELAKELGYKNFNDYASNIDGNFYCAERMVNFQRKVYQLIQNELKIKIYENAKIDVKQTWNSQITEVVTLKKHSTAANYYYINKDSILNVDNIT